MSDSEEWEDAVSSFSDDEFKDAEDENLEYYSKRNPNVIKKSLFTMPEYSEENDSESDNNDSLDKNKKFNDNNISHINSSETINVNSFNDTDNNDTTDNNNNNNDNKREYLSAHRQPPIDLRNEKFNVTNIMEESLKEATSQDTLHEEDKNDKEIRELEEEIDKILSCSPEEIEV
ncbi:hypothetical protein BCR32DRAFT_274412 [Anaeromyces robustus]|uniref:Uncharacterized protein n=1 Tax=Anaeromyces robustus TaxID=1754192 RepID=A0A1Y1XPF0_9FUNG|nr:hypothetical protein BCR32DRAFT_274412 [Anaeromyces robustus]|eukprot:ORX87623.1 hypothetical protein BCR32DRAFT_274412 [Anaeromyces robustus]